MYDGCYSKQAIEIFFPIVAGFGGFVKILSSLFSRISVKLFCQVNQMIAVRRGRTEESPHSLEQGAG